MAQWKLYSYDVWGNAEDGYEVNDVIGPHETVELSEEDLKTDKSLHKALLREGIFKKSYKYGSFEYDGDEDIIYIERSKDGYPEGELRRVKGNPGLKWHRKQEDVHLKKHKGAMTKEGAKYYEGKIHAHQDSIREHWRRGHGRPRRKK